MAIPKHRERRAARSTWRRRAGGLRDTLNAHDAALTVLTVFERQRQRLTNPLIFDGVARDVTLALEDFGRWWS